MANGFPNASFSTTDNEVLLYIDQALAFSLVGQVYAAAKVEGSLAVPEAFLVTYLLPALQQDNVTKEWYSLLPQPPISLPLGHSIDEVYFANSSNGKGTQVALIKAKRTGYRDYLPSPPNVMAKIEGSKIILQAPSGTSLLNQNLYVRMATTRTTDINAVMNVPDDTLELIFNNVVMKMKDRLQLPKDVIVDDISAGNKGS